MRKTFEREKVLKEINHVLAFPVKPEAPEDRMFVCKEAKRIICTAIESILFEHDCYRGFSWNVGYEAARTIGPDDERYYDRFYY